MFTVDQINQLAPDAASLKAGREQAKPGKWQGLGVAEGLVWGLIQGSGKAPYQTVVDASGPAFHCSCPSRKFPCKHGLGLLFVLAEQGIAPAPPPDWVADWRSKRSASAEKKAAKPAAELTPQQAATKEAASEKRQEKRQALMAEGFAQTQLWLEDLITQGLAWAQAQPSGYWAEQVARLTNAQAPGAARLVDGCAAAAHSGEGWPARLLAELSRLHLLCRAWPQAAQLPEAARAELFATAGISQASEDVLAQAGMQGTWQVLARIAEERDTLRSYRHWLWCWQTGRITQVFHFAAGSQPLDTTLPPGLVFEGELCFYSGLIPRRALIKSRQPSTSVQQLLTAKGQPSLAAALASTSQAWAIQPWLPQQPLLFTATPNPAEGGFVDDAGHTLPWASRFTNGWLLAAIAGGRPLHVFGEIGSDGFLPLLAAVPDTSQVWTQRFEH